MTPLAIDFPPIEFLIFAVALLIGLIGKIVEFAKEIRRKSIETGANEERQFGHDLGEVPEPPTEEVPVRLALVRRPLPRRELPRALAEPVVPARPPPPPAMAPPRPRREHPVLRMLDEPHGAKNAIVLAEILGPPKALRRWR